MPSLLEPWQIRGLVGLFQAMLWALGSVAVVAYGDMLVAAIVSTAFGAGILSLMLPRALLREVPQVSACFPMFLFSAFRLGDNWSIVVGAAIGGCAAALAARLLICRIGVGRIVATGLVAALAAVAVIRFGDTIARGLNDLGESVVFSLIVVAPAALYLGNRCRFALQRGAPPALRQAQRR
jgi:hypothetical protein